MCGFCENLIKCPVGEKRSVVVDRPKESKVIDAYGHTLHVGDTLMFVDKYKDHVDAGIFRDVYTEDNVQYGGGIEINNCPFCGEKIR